MILVIFSDDGFEIYPASQLLKLCAHYTAEIGVHKISNVKFSSVHHICAFLYPVAAIKENTIK